MCTQSVPADATGTSSAEIHWRPFPDAAADFRCASARQVANRKRSPVCLDRLSYSSLPYGVLIFQYLF